MLIHRIANLLHFDRKTSLFFLAFFSCTGALLGVTTAYSSDSYLYSLMRMASLSPVSIVGLIPVTLFPFLITAIALYISKPYLFLLFSFIKTFLHAFVASCICLDFLSAGWLVGRLLLFSDTVVIITLHWYWIRYIHGFRDTAISDLLSSIAVSLTVGFIDYFWVSPFLITLVND